MKIMLTGATGYLGSCLLPALLHSGHQVVAVKRSTSETRRIAGLLNEINWLDCDLTDTAGLFTAAGPIDVVLHAATSYGRQGESLGQLVATNLAWPVELLTHARAAGVRYFMNAGTSIPAEVSDYALSKQQFAAWGRRCAATGGPGFVNMVLEHFYGPGDDSSKFIAWLIENLLANTPELPLTPGEQVRDFVYIDDVVNAFLTVLGRLEASAPAEMPACCEYAVGSGAGIRIRDLVEMLHELCASDTELRFGAVAYRPEEVMLSQADMTSLGALGWRPEVSLPEGLARTVKRKQEGF